MSRNLLNKYIWLLETIERHGRLSRAELKIGRASCRERV